MRLLATRETYYKRTIRAGEEFEAKDSHAKTLKTLKHCVDAPPPAVAAAPVKPMDTGNSEAIVPVRRGRYGRRDAQADDDTPAPVTYTPPDTLHYRRRDMRAEGE